MPRSELKRVRPEYIKRYGKWKKKGKNTGQGANAQEQAAQTTSAAADK
jgi:hypothetical protein